MRPQSPSRVITGKAQAEQMFPGLLSKADLRSATPLVRRLTSAYPRGEQIVPSYDTDCLLEEKIGGDAICAP
jgi:hypothetical protein